MSQAILAAFYRDFSKRYGADVLPRIDRGVQSALAELLDGVDADAVVDPRTLLDPNFVERLIEAADAIQEVAHVGPFNPADVRIVATHDLAPSPRRWAEIDWRGPLVDGVAMAIRRHRRRKVKRWTG